MAAYIHDRCLALTSSLYISLATRIIKGPRILFFGASFKHHFAGGKKVGCSIVETFSKDVKPKELEEVLRLEYRSKLLNPKWAEVWTLCPHEAAARLLWCFYHGPVQAAPQFALNQTLISHPYMSFGPTRCLCSTRKLLFYARRCKKVLSSQ